MRAERSEPILPGRDLDELQAFYEKLGFKAWFKSTSTWGYQILSRGHLVVHFYSVPGLEPKENNCGCYLRVKDADRMHQEFAALDLPSKGIPRLTTPEDMPWGMREFVVVDPSGNAIRVGHDLKDAYIPQRDAI